MQALHLDLADKMEFSKGKKVLFFSFSATFIFLGIFGIYMSIIDGKEFFTSTVYILLGIVYFMQALNLEIFKTKEFITIDQEKVNFKLSVFRKEKFLNWNQITKVEVKKTYILFHTAAKPIELSLSWVSYKNALRIKLVLRDLTSAKNIEFVRKE